jgi:hypothetical protein
MHERLVIGTFPVSAGLDHAVKVQDAVWGKELWVVGIV